MINNKKGLHNFKGERLVSFAEREREDGGGEEQTNTTVEQPCNQ